MIQHVKSQSSAGRGGEDGNSNDIKLLRLIETGEKLYEELLIDSKAQNQTVFLRPMKKYDL